MEFKVVARADGVAKKLSEIAIGEIAVAYVAKCIEEKRCVALYSKSELVGVVTYYMTPFKVVLNDLFIVKKWRKRGLAYALMYMCIDEIQSHYNHDVEIYAEWLDWCYKVEPMFQNIGIKINRGLYQIDVTKLEIKAKKAMKRYNIKRD